MAAAEAAAAEAEAAVAAAAAAAVAVARKPTYQILASYYPYNPPKSFRWWVVGGGWIPHHSPKQNIIF